jgi:hypothetical protein
MASGQREKHQEILSGYGPHEFFTDLFGSKPDNTHIQICSNNFKTTDHFESISEAAAEVDMISGTGDVYVAVGLSGSSPGPTRSKAAEVAGLPGLYLDIDIDSGDDTHQKKNLPKSLDEAIRVSELCGITPSVIVHSGNGIHCWYLFDKVKAIDSVAENARAQKLSEMFARTVNTLVAKNENGGYAIDSVYDLARVLRIPGTSNFKSDPPKPVQALKAIQNPSERYDFEQLYQIFVTDNKIIPQTSTPLFGEQKFGVIEGGKAGPACSEKIQQCLDGLVFDQKANPPFELFLDIQEILAPEFGLTFNKQRDDLDGGDGSASAYDMSLTNMAVRAGWSDQEICNLLIAFRRKHGMDLKLPHNGQYYARTIVRVREDLAARSMGKKTPSEIEEAKKRLTSKLGFRIHSLIKKVSDEPSYTMDTEYGRVSFETVQDLILPSRFKSTVTKRLNFYPRTGNNKHWPGIIDDFMVILEEVYISDDMMIDTRLAEYIKEYLEAYGNIRLNVHDAAVQKAPFVKEGLFHFSWPKFEYWLKVNRDVYESTSTMQKAAYDLGLKAVKLNVKKGGSDGATWTTSRAWSVPLSICDPNHNDEVCPDDEDLDKGLDEAAEEVKEIISKSI